eukprot:TRINITY_DN27138_c0_g1_i1.p1 TRINITY_DN27138_c0_g1~~TRINITY_DN27138_c0_g1_i1.p1  ORF type:complete len:182 (+),score=44.18 TRINITY_DN27138_c0_g1_i1:243-788(+)
MEVVTPSYNECGPPFISLGFACGTTTLTVACVTFEAVVSTQSTGDTVWLLQVKCLFCGESPEKMCPVVEKMSYPITGSRGVANLVKRCKCCKKEGFITIVKDSIVSYMIDDSEHSIQVASVDCRGLGVIDWSLQNVVVQGATSGVRFEACVDDPDGWSSWDERVASCIGVYDLTYTTSRSK